MPGRVYNWKRFWCPREGNIALTDAGYLVDPDTPWAHIQNRDVVSFDAISDVPCLVLLGEPGMGKTYALRTQAALTRTRVHEAGDRVLWFELGRCSSEERLVRKLFQSATFTAWERGDHQLHLFLDSLDEGLLGINSLSELLADELAEYPVDRLWLRLTCRTAAWPNTLEDALESMWQRGEVGIYELAPLRLTDVAEAANINGVAADEFLQEVSRMEAAPLATRPVTLGFLLKTFARRGALPSRRSDLYEQGCELLCEESNESRRERGHKGQYTASQRLAVAARIAAVTVYGNRYAVWRGANPADLPEEDVRLPDLCGGYESYDGKVFQVDENAVTEALDTGLFSSRGPSRMGWTHETYAEFLAAWYVAHSDMTLGQIMSLIGHPGDPDGRLVPQLHETAAWLAGMRADVFNEILTSDPEVLLRSDVATAEQEDRARLVQEFLHAHDRGLLLPPHAGDTGVYSKLAHAGLPQQLRSYLRDRGNGALSRRVAIRILQACGLTALQHDLVNTALDLTEPMLVRQGAAAAVCRLGDEEAKARLKPLAIDPGPDDGDDELKGIALRATWPRHISAQELFSSLRPPKCGMLLGMYYVFLAQDLSRDLEPPDLPVALQWVEGQCIAPSLPNGFEAAMDGILTQALQHMQQDSVGELLARASLARLKHHGYITKGPTEPGFHDILSHDDEKRRRLVSEMIGLISHSQEDFFFLLYPGNQLVTASDLPWILDQLSAAQPPAVQDVLTDLASHLFHPDDRERADLVYTACQSNPKLAEAFAWLLAPVTLDSEQAQRMKDSHRKRKALERRRDDTPPIDPPPAERVETLLKECESGNPDAWWRVNMEMTLLPNSHTYGDPLQSDLTALPGWQAADGETRGRIVEAGWRYVLHKDPRTHEWLGTSKVHHRAFSGFRALRLLLQEARNLLDGLPAEAWKAWAPIILAYPTSTIWSGRDAQCELTERAYKEAPQEILDTLLVMIDKENGELDRIFITDRVLACWDPLLEQTLLTKVMDPKLKPESMGCLFVDLLEHGSAAAASLARSLVSAPPPPAGLARSRAVVAAEALVPHAQDAGWRAVWAAIQEDTEFGRELMTRVAFGSDRRSVSIGKALDEHELADLYIWLTHQYPYGEDPKHEGAYCVGPREAVGDYRDSILTHLREKGSDDACREIQRIAREFPSLGWLKWTLLEARALARRNTWSPPHPSDILRMAADRNTRLVQTGAQLLDVIAESIGRLEKALQEGQPPAAIDLWNEVSGSDGAKHTPKDENRLSDYVKRHLDADVSQRAIVVNREVQITRRDKTDIHVTAATREPDANTYDSIDAIVETKGCWSSELHSAMEMQLVDRYLMNSGCPHGIYLVGWFNCDHWQEDSPRRRAAARAGADIQDLRRKLDEQAAALSTGTMIVRALVLNAALS